MHTPYDDDKTIKVSQKWFMEVGWAMFNEDPTTPQALYFENKVSKMNNRLEYAKKLHSLNDE